MEKGHEEHQKHRSALRALKKQVVIVTKWYTFLGQTVTNVGKVVQHRTRLENQYAY